MVRRIIGAFGAITRIFLLVVVRSVARFLIGDERASFVRGVVKFIFSFEKRASLEAFVTQISSHAWVANERNLIFVACCELFESDVMPDKIIEKFSSVSGGAIHYSQEGEDLILARLLGEKKNGFFVDVGAHHPTRFSNTYALYRRGWRGINIDATPGSMSAFEKLRPDDVNLEMAISDRSESFVFSMFQEGALNTFDRELAQSYLESGWALAGTVELVPLTLKQVLDKYLKPDQKIDLLSIDVEGEDLGVLRSNDWSKYCPEVVIIEALDTPLERLDESPVVFFLKEQGFSPISRLFNSIIFRKNHIVCAVS